MSHPHLTRRVASALLLLLLSWQSASAAETIRINGTGCGVTLMKPLIAAFQKSHPDVTFEAQKSVGSAASLKAIAKGALDIAVPGRDLKPQEKLPTLAWYEYGRTPYAVVTHRDTKLDNVTTGQLAAMFAGTLGKWGNGDFVRVVLRPNDDIDTTVLRSLSPEMDRAVTAAHARPDMLMGITDQETFEHLKKTAGTVSFIPLIMPLSEPGTVNVARLNGVPATLPKLAAGKYSYAKRIFLVTRKDPSPGVKAFLQFLESKKARALAQKHGLLTSAAR
ncbi:Phosphate ABC transporter, substrate-binding protein PstS [Citrifermentans bremense]|uniref:Phosphate ABC transporter, substrate-binding protein PstS n=1 Tax=Citrifermentans bremense TaxID=60035 RepID=A0A6S6LW70_9BACT|nr:substrate-binding domain-containing protein [Citrifermentans bremense]BCG45903.1 Phosphate ABC transporter, substrate-binding protein PstS [Citrifermentans bremense]